MTRSRSTAALLAAAVAALAPGVLTPLATAAAAVPTGAFTAGPKLISATRLLLPGDHLAVGWALQAAGNHPTATYYLSHLAMTFPVSCTAGGHASTITLKLPDGKATLAAGSEAWAPTSNPAAVASYQFSSVVPNLCGGRPLWLPTVDDRGVVYTGIVSSTDTSHPVRLTFHAVDAHTNMLAHLLRGDPHREFTGIWTAEEGQGARWQSANIDCSSATQNAGISACKGAWSPSVQVNTATRAPATGTGGGTPGGGVTGGTSGGVAGGGPGGTGVGVGVGVGTPGGTGVTVSVTTGGISVGAGVLGTHVRAAVHLPAVSRLQSSAPAGPPAPAPAATADPAAPTSPSNSPSGAGTGISTVIGPVPVLAPSTIADTLVRTGATLPWRWFAVLATVDLLLVGIVLRRRRGREARTR